VLFSEIDLRLVRCGWANTLSGVEGDNLLAESIEDSCCQDRVIIQLGRHTLRRTEQQILIEDPRPDSTKTQQTNSTIQRM